MDGTESPTHLAAENETPSEGRLVATVIRELCPGTLPPWDPALREHIELSLEWQKVGLSAQFWEMGTTRAEQRDRGYELAGRIASVGEQFGLAGTAALNYLAWP